MIPNVKERVVELQRLCVRYRVLRLDLFGSAATDDDRRGESDLDFRVEFQTLPSGESMPTPSSGCWKPSNVSLDTVWISLSTRPSKTLSSDNASTRPGHRSMRLEALKYLYDVRKAAGLLNEFVRDKTFADYHHVPQCTDPRIRRRG